MSANISIHGKLEAFELSQLTNGLSFIFENTVFGSGSAISNEIILYLDDRALACKLGDAIKAIFAAHREELACGKPDLVAPSMMAAQAAE